MRTYRVLITAIGGNIGQGILKALRSTKKRFYIAGIDAEPLSAGFAYCDNYYNTPRTTDAGFRKVLEKILQKERIEAIYICSPNELEFFSDNKDDLEKKHDLSVLVNGPDAVRIGSDKLETAMFLKKHGFPCPETVIASDTEGINYLINKYGFPLFMKPQKGFTSHNVFLVNSYEQIDAARKLVPDLILQQYIPDLEGEYTAGTVSGVDGKVVADIILRRYLNQGTTYRSELLIDKKISGNIKRIAESLGSVGPCNFQFRILRGIPYVFEINPRFSGTSGIRYLYGFNDPEIIFDIIRLGKKVEQPKLRQATVLRYWNEIYVPNVGFDDLRGKKIFRRGKQVVLVKP